MLATLKTNIAEVLSPVLGLDGAYIQDAIVFSARENAFVFHLFKIVKNFNEKLVCDALESIANVREVTILNGFLNVQVHDSFFEIDRKVKNVNTSFNKEYYLSLCPKFNDDALYGFYALKQRLSILLKNNETGEINGLDEESRKFLVDISYKLYRLNELSDINKKLLKLIDLKLVFDQVYLYENFKNHSSVVFLAASLIYHQVMLFDKTLHTGM